MNASLVMQDEEFRMMNSACERLVRDANVRVVFVIDKNGQLMASGGEADRLDSTSLASLVAGEYAATNGIAQLIGEKDFSVLFHEGVNDSLHISLVASRAILVVIFDKRSSLGLVRLRVKKVSEEIGKILDVLVKRAQAPGGQKTPMTEITDDDIDNLFAD
jgi:predicted regulator of Ras-like GTPase activity (Roadblock/LC7/MglB family)